MYWIKSFLMSYRENQQISKLCTSINEISNYCFLEVKDLSNFLNHSMLLKFPFNFKKHKIFFPRPIIEISTNNILPQITSKQILISNINSKYFPILESKILKIENEKLIFKCENFSNVEILKMRINSQIQEKKTLFQKSKKYLISDITIENALLEMKNLGIEINIKILNLISINIFNNDFEWAKLLFKDLKIEKDFVCVLAKKKYSYNKLSFSEKCILIFYLIKRLQTLSQFRRGKNDPFGIREDAKNILILVFSISLSDNEISYNFFRYIQENLDLIAQNFSGWEEVCQKFKIPYFNHLNVLLGNSNFKIKLNNNIFVSNKESQLIINRIKKFVNKIEKTEYSNAEGNIPAEWNWMLEEIDINNINLILDNVKKIFDNIYIANSKNKIFAINYLWKKIKIFLNYF